MVTVEGLQFGYQRGEAVIRDLYHEFQAGTVCAVTGPSGRGKSTLLYLIGLLLTPWSGRVGIDEFVSASQLSDVERSGLRATRIGFVFQDAILDPSRSVMDNVIEGAIYAGISRRTARAQAVELLRRFDVLLRADHKPGEVSGGQAQRVALCRALLNRPRLILADEPTGNLDAGSADVVIDALEAAAHADGATVILASHDPRVVAKCDDVLRL